MPKAFVDPVDLAPFVAWCNAREQQLTELMRSGAPGAPTDPTHELLKQLGWAEDAGTRRLYRYRGGEQLTGQAERQVLEDALHHAGVAWWEVYPDDQPEITGELHDRWCPKCREQVTTDDTRICPWCDTPTEEERPRRGGWKRPDLAGKTKLTDTQLRALHRAYIQQGLSINALAKQIHAKVGYRSPHSAAVAISNGWKRLGLPARDRIQAVQLACTTHGMAPKHGPRPGYGTYKRKVLNGQEDRPRCAAVKQLPPGKGQPCTHRALNDSEYCWAHDERRELERQAICARMRRRRPPKEMLPMGPFIAWLHELRAELGTFTKVAERTGLPRSGCYRYAKGQDTAGRPKTLVSVDLVRRAAAAAGTTVDAIYGRELEELAA